MECDVSKSSDVRKLEANPAIAKQLQSEAALDFPLVLPLRSVLIFLAATLASAVVLELLPIAGSGFFNALQLHSILRSQPKEADYSSASIDPPTFAIFGKSKTEDHLKHVLKVLQRLGFRRTSTDSNWNLLWAHDYPFWNMSERLKQLQPQQQVNHMPGCGFLTNKVDLSTTPLGFLPKAFKLPAERDEFMQYFSLNSNTLFVVKNNEHRNIEIRLPHEINFDSKDTFVQEFIQNPFLVDGYKFDIGVYVLITSVDPLRLYIYTGDVLFRYCAVKYYPFDRKRIDAYVVGDDYLPTWEVPSLVKYYMEYGGSMRGAFDAYVRDQSMDPAVIWSQVDDIVRRTVLAKEGDMARIWRNYKSRNFFELTRFDMIIDDRLRVYLMEVNMSPNLSSAHFKPNSLLYEQILYSVFNLLGLGSTVSRMTFEDSASEDLKDMIVAEKNLVTNLNSCAANDCDKRCDADACQLCLGCLSGTEYSILESAYREHLHKADMRRLFPKPILNPESYDIKEEVQNISHKNAWMSRWYYGKCLYDSSWCH